jgi:murein DD-endopeptidase MepM/ murein hydrolase activator NlpD
MSQGERRSRPGLPTTHYFLSLSRGDAMRTAVLVPAVFWTLVALLPLSLGFGTAGAAYFAFHDAFTRAAIVRAAEARRAAEDELAVERSRLDALANQRLVEQGAYEGRLKSLLSREARLERDGAVVAALATEAAHGTPQSQARAEDGALQAIEAVTGARKSARAATSDIRAYTPAPSLEPKPAQVPSPAHADLSAADNSGLDFKTRLDLAGLALDRIEGGQMISLAAVDRVASRAAARNSAILLEAGLDPDRLAQTKPLRATGGPFVTAEFGPDAPAFDRAAGRVARDVAAAERLTAVMPSIPLRLPLPGEATMSSPFGYRADPFLGRLALHTGVDLTEGYGAEIRATAAGLVVHAGPMGGYGTMVEIDHGNGLVTRYGHMSETIVSEGQEVEAGDTLGRVGSTGRSTGPHLHYEVRIDGEPVDPERFLRAGARLAASE